MANVFSTPVIVIGGGLVGLTLAQSLKKANIPCTIYERDASLDSDRGGWGITIHWALRALERCLPTKLFEELDDIQVDPAQAKCDTIPLS